MDSQGIDPEILRGVQFSIVIIVTVIAVCATTIAAIAFLKAEAEAFSLMVQKAGALQLITVMSIVAAACFLALIGKVAPEGVISLLSGIAGYVLGGYSRSERHSTSQAPAPPPTP